jgi:uncharacterized protein (TIGR03435 family)
LAYGVQNSQISGGPDWLDSEKYDIEARLGSAAIDELSRLSPDERNQEHLRMIQALLVDRFKLALHRETRQVPGYALAIAKDGPKLHEAKTGDPYSNGLKDPRGRPVGAGTLVQPGPCKLVGQGVPIASLVGELSQQLDRSVVDETGLKGNYDFTLDCHKALRELGGSLLTVLPEQLGLELKEQTLPVEMLVIDHAEQVTADESSPPQSQTQNAAAPLFESASIKPNTSGNAVRAQSTSSTSPVFEVATIKLHKSGDEKQSMTYPANGFIATNVTLWMLLRVAYGVEDNQISGAQNWFNAESYDVEASVDRPVAEELRKLTRDQRAAKQQPMLQALLADRFKLALHRETKELPVYALVIAKDGPKLQEAKPGDTYSNGLKGLDGLPAGPNYTVMRRNQLTTQARPVLSLARDLSRVLGSPVLDKTGLTGNYDFTLHWTSDESLAGVFKGTGSSGTLSPDSSGPSIFTAVQEQLGLELKEQTAPAQVLVIDHAERPSGN